MITMEMKDRVVLALVDSCPGSRPLHVGDILSKVDGIEVNQAIEIVRELESMGLVFDVTIYPGDLKFRIHAGLDTFAECGGFKAKYTIARKELEKIMLEIASLKSEVEPSLYDKIMKTLEPIEKIVSIGGAFIGVL